MTLPTVGFVIPTLNAERVLEDCLDSIVGQDYPADRREIVIADGGSADRTLEIVASFRQRGLAIRVVPNPLKTGEAGKQAGLEALATDLIALVDSDNLLPDPGWLRAMVRPFGEDGTILAAEPIAYTYRREDGYINRYCALLGMNDPLCLFLGNYDRLCLLTGRWTGLPVEVQERPGYLRVQLQGGAIPTLGANGFLIRREILRRLSPGPYLFDVDLLPEAVRRCGTVAVAKVDTGIVHLYCRDFRTFVRKQRRRVLDYHRHRGRERARDPWGYRRLRGVALFILCSLSIVPLVVQSCIGLGRRRDVCWWFHIPASLATLGIYGYYSVRGFTGRCGGMNREGWSQ